MSEPLHAFDYLEKPPAGEPPPVCVVFGDDRFLKRLVCDRLRGRDEKNAADDGVPPDVLDGDEATWRDVLDRLSTPMLFGGGRRAVLVDNAEAFISRNREQLEKYVEKPRRSGLLILDAATWPGNTRLYKGVARSGWAIACRPPERAAGRRTVPDEGRLADWIIQRAARRHQIKLRGDGAQTLLEILGSDLGTIDQNLAKLALYVEAKGSVDATLVRDVVGGWRAKTAWAMIEAAVDGDANEAITQLDRLLQAGQDSQALFGAIAWSLRRYAAAIRIVERAERARQRIDLPQLLEEAGFRKWPREELAAAERQLKQLGRRRAGRLYRWLLETDLALKGSHSSAGRGQYALELLLLRLSKMTAPAKRLEA
jgi:DNA polymerase-3 subunit delta